MKSFENQRFMFYLIFNFYNHDASHGGVTPLNLMTNPEVVTWIRCHPFWVRSGYDRIFYSYVILSGLTNYRFFTIHLFFKLQ
jgi:hypothetical protein